MRMLATRHDSSAPALLRLRALTPLSVEAVAAIVASSSFPRTIPHRRELLTEGGQITEPLLLLEGWAAKVRILQDGRRQFIGFVLPGEVIGHCGFTGAIASSTVTALTDVKICALPDAAGPPDLARAYAISRALDEAYMAAQVTRLGRLEAHERIIDLLLELHERLSLSGLAAGGNFTFPLTQEMFADALGLTSVHVNRMVQVARRREELTWSGKSVRLLDSEALNAALGRTPVRVS